MIEQERKGSTRGDPDNGAQLWADKLAETDRKRARYQEIAAADLVTFDELKSRLYELDQTRETAERELEALRNRSQRVAELEADCDALLAQLANTAPTALNSLTPEERHHLYKMLGLRIFTYPDRPPEVEFGEGFGVRDLKTAQGRGPG